MVFSSEGLEPTSCHFYIQPSDFARRHLYYLQSLGHFDVNSSYRVNRFNYNNILMLAMLRGTMYCLQGRQMTAVPAGSVLLLDCSMPHSYFCDTNASFDFMHFSGAESRALASLIREKYGLAMDLGNIRPISDFLSDIISRKQQNKSLNERLISAGIYRLLMLLLDHSMETYLSQDYSAILSQVIDEMMKHLDDRLNITELARRHGFSAPQFSAIFRQSTGFTPYQFILNSRLSKSQHLLTTTTLSIQEVADQCGFPSLSNFGAAFRKKFGVTPREFRKHPL